MTIANAYMHHSVSMSLSISLSIEFHYVNNTVNQIVCNDVKTHVQVGLVEILL